MLCNENGKNNFVPTIIIKWPNTDDPVIKIARCSFSKRSFKIPHEKNRVTLQVLSIKFILLFTKALQMWYNFSISKVRANWICVENLNM